MQINDLITVTVTRVEPGFVLVDFNGQETTLQQTELTWKAGAVNPSDYVKEGDEITVRVIAKDGDRFSISLKQVTDNTWDNPPQIGKQYQSKVVMVAEYGYFVNIEYYCNALLACEQAKANHLLGDVVNVKVIKVDAVKGSVFLSEL